jgi:hypothetical protein
MAMKGSGGGGINSRQHVEIKQNLGRSRKGISPGGVSQLGYSVGNHPTDGSGTTNYRGDGWLDNRTGISVPLGNQLATNVGAGGPGTGRTVMRSGSQQTWGDVNPGQPRPNPMHDALKGQ